MVYGRAGGGRSKAYEAALGDRPDHRLGGRREAVAASGCSTPLPGYPQSSASWVELAVALKDRL